MSETMIAPGDRGEMQRLYIRVCRDSGFRIPFDRAAKIAGAVLKRHPIEIWGAVGSLDDMMSIAEGKHPAALTEKD